MKSERIIISIMATLTIFLAGCAGCTSKDPEPVISESVEQTEPAEEPEKEPEPEVEPTPEPEPVQAEPEPIPEPEPVEAEPEPEYTIIPMDDTQMFATSNANIRRGPSTSYEKAGSLNYSQEVTINGKVESGDSTWYVLKTSDRSTQMVSSSLLSTTKPQQQTPKPAQQPQQPQQPAGGSSGGLETDDGAEPLGPSGGMFDFSDINDDWGDGDWGLY